MHFCKWTFTMGYLFGQNFCCPRIHKWIGWCCLRSRLLNVCLLGNAIIVGLWILTCQTKTKNNQINTSICCAGWQCTSIPFWQYHWLNILSKSPVCAWYLPLGSVSLGWRNNPWPLNPEMSNKNKKQPYYYKYLLYMMTMYFNSIFTMYCIIYWTFWVSHLFAPDIFHLDLFLWGDVAIFGQWILRCQTKTKKPQITTSICCTGLQCTSIPFLQCTVSSTEHFEQVTCLHLISSTWICFSWVTQQSLASESWGVKQKQKNISLFIYLFGSFKLNSTTNESYYFLHSIKSQYLRLLCLSFPKILAWETATISHHWPMCSPLRQTHCFLSILAIVGLRFLLKQHYILAMFPSWIKSIYIPSRSRPWPLSPESHLVPCCWPWFPPETTTTTLSCSHFSLSTTGKLLCHLGLNPSTYLLALSLDLCF